MTEFVIYDINADQLRIIEGDLLWPLTWQMMYETIHGDFPFEHLGKL